MSTSTQTVLDKQTQIKKLQDEILKAQQAAKEALLREGQAIIEQLTLLGYKYALKQLTHEGKGSVRLCGQCGKPGHNVRTCPNTPQEIV